MSSQSGFTLIEGLVAGIISVVIPGVLLTLINVNNTELAYNSTQLRLTQIANVVSDDIRRTAFKATQVYSTAEAGPGGCPLGDPNPAHLFDLTGVVFCDAAKQMIKGYQVVRVSPGSTIGRLEEREFGAAEWSSVVIGSEEVQLDFNPNPYQQKLGGLFGLSTGSKGQFMFFNFHYRMNVANVPSTLSMQTESVVCRNAPSFAW